MDLLRQRIGRTVLYESKPLREKFNSGPLFLKMEGLNPTGRIQDRIAYYLVQEARQLGFDTVTVASLGALGISMAYVCAEFNVKCKIVTPNKSIIKKSNILKEDVVEIIEHGKNYREANKKSIELAKEKSWYDANHGYFNFSITTTVYSEIAEEISHKLGKNPDNIFVFLSNGALISGLHHGFRQLWRQQKIDRIPKIHVVCADEENSLYQTYLKGKKIYSDKKATSTYKGKAKKTYKYDIFEPQAILNAVYDTGGRFHFVKQEKIKENQKLLKSKERIKTGVRGGAVISAFERASRENEISKDEQNVIMLEEGKSDLIIKELSDDDFRDFDQLADYVDAYLGKYGDARDGAMEAIKVSYETGFLLGAYVAGEMKGIAVVMGLPTNIVMPPYHLIYIGTDLSTGSRGIGTKLMEKIYEKTGGHFSLHVDIENKKAIKLYQKMGLKKAYFRMISEGEE
ncbi:MAG: pyridoxal-phosphate dependent enzyme [Candidatus Muiribacteriota bacterium]